MRRRPGKFVKVVRGYKTGNTLAIENRPPCGGSWLEESSSLAQFARALGAAFGGLAVGNGACSTRECRELAVGAVAGFGLVERASASADWF